MRHFVLTILITVSASIGLAQNFSKLENIPLNDSMDCKNAEPKVLECCNYLLTTPCEETLNRLKAVQFIMKWMENTSDYTFTLDKIFLSVSKSNKVLISNLFASMAKTAITETMNENFTFKYITIFAEYCENPKYKVKQSAFIKKMIKAKNDNTLAEFIRENSK